MSKYSHRRMPTRLQTTYLCSSLHIVTYTTRCKDMNQFGWCCVCSVCACCLIVYCASDLTERQKDDDRNRRIKKKIYTQQLKLVETYTFQIDRITKIVDDDHVDNDIERCDGHSNGIDIDIDDTKAHAAESRHAALSVV